MNIKQKFRPDRNLKLPDQLKQVLCYHQYSYDTEQAYCNWIVKFLKFHPLEKHPREMGKKEIDAFLSHLAVKEKVAISTQRQARNAIVFLYHQALTGDIAELYKLRAGDYRVFYEALRDEGTHAIGPGRETYRKG